MTPARRLTALAACLLLTLSCGDSSGPDGGGGPGQGGRVAIGDTVSLAWNTRTFYDFYLRPHNARAFAVLGDAVYDDFVIEVTDSATGAVLNGASVAGHPPHPSYQLDDHHTGPAELAAQQTARIRVVRGTPLTTGARFRIFVAPVNLAPENHAAVLQPGDTVNGETMANAVDVDRFYLRNTTGALLELAVFAQSRAGYLYLSVLDSTLGLLLSSGSFVPDLTVRPVPFTRVNTVAIQPNQIVEIQALQFGPGSGDYQLWAYPVNRAPESVPAAIAINDTIQGELLENNADIDEFTVSVGTRADMIAYYQGGTSRPEISMSISGGGYTMPLVVTNGPSGSLEQLNTTVFQPPIGGTIKITHGTAGNDVPVSHPYTFMVRQVDRQPEQLAPAIAIGDSIVGESIDYVGDIDEFSFTGTAGQTVTITARALSGFPVNPIKFDLIENGGSWAEASTNNGVVGTISFQLPVSGTYWVLLRSRYSGAGTGGYEVLVQ